MPELGLIGPSYTLNSQSANSQRCMNLYPVLDETQRGKSVGRLVRTPGLKPFCTLPGPGAVRPGGLYTATNGRVFCAQGEGFWELRPDGTFIQLGPLQSTTGAVSMADNGVDLVLVDGQHGYSLGIYTGPFVGITDPNFLGADFVQFLDNYLVFNHPNTGQFYYSGLSAVTFDALDFAAEEGSPDFLLAILASHRQLWLFGNLTTAVWFTVGDLDNPFQRDQGTFIEQGILAPRSAARVGETVCWLAQNTQGAGYVVQAVGANAERISTFAVDEALQRAGRNNLTDAMGWCQQEDGHIFYWLTFPTANMTWVYDATTNLWHERGWLNPATGDFDRHRAASYCYGYGRHLVGDHTTGQVYTLDPSVYQDADHPQRWLRRVPYVLGDGLLYVFHNVVTLDLEVGVGLDGIQQGTDPQVALRYSDDGGASWSLERWTSMGKIGAGRQRARWLRLGRSRSRVYEVSGADPVKTTLLAAYLEAEGGTA